MPGQGNAMLMSIKQACETLSIGRSHLWCLIRADKIRTVRIGKRGIRIPESEIKRFVQQGLEDSKGNSDGE